MGHSGAALLRAGDDIAAALCGWLHRRGTGTRLRPRGAMRQADPGGAADDPTRHGPCGRERGCRGARRSWAWTRRPSTTCSCSARRADGEGHGELVEELARRLARDPARRPQLVADARRRTSSPSPAARGVMARPFGDAVAGLSHRRRGGRTWRARCPRRAGRRHTRRRWTRLRVVPAMSAAPGGSRSLASPSSEPSWPTRSSRPLGVDRWLGPLLTRGPGWSASSFGPWRHGWRRGESVAATARVLRVAPRTVSYRLDRVARLLGVRALDAADPGPSIAALRPCSWRAVDSGRDRVASKS